jgi:hypothetical protein
VTVDLNEILQYSELSLHPNALRFFFFTAETRLMRKKSSEALLFCAGTAGSNYLNFIPPGFCAALFSFTDMSTYPTIHLVLGYLAFSCDIHAS